jgi:iron(III) transport system permease protein
MHKNWFAGHVANPWVLVTLIAAIVISVPLLVVMGSLTGDAGAHWQHILTNLVPEYTKNTLLLLLGVSVLIFVLGVSTAYLVTTHSFPGRRFFEWALILPIAIPGYIAGFTYAGMLDYTSPLYTFFRNSFGINTGQYFLFDMLSLPGAVFIFSFTLYPYVYLITRAYLLQQSSTLTEVSASLGRSPFYTFTRVIIPVARPAIAAGVSLALMEVLNDYGLVKYYGVDTFTTGIFTAWFAFGSIGAALRLSALMLIFVIVLIFLERFQRRKMQFTSDRTERPVLRRQAKGALAWLFAAACLIPLLFGFLIPFTKLIYWTVKVLPDTIAGDFWILLGNSFFLALLAALFVVIIAVILAYSRRIYPLPVIKSSVRMATLGYALPGAVVAVGLLATFLWFEHRTNMLFGSGLQMALTGTWFALVFAYVVRYMAVGFNGIESGLQKIPVSLDRASRSLGRSKLKTLLLVNLPLLKGPLVAGALLVFIDVLKELPLTLILRPFNFDTLAIRSFEYASDERIAEAAPAAVIIVLTGLLPVILLNKLLNRQKT